MFISGLLKDLSLRWLLPLTPLLAWIGNDSPLKDSANNRGAVASESKICSDIGIGLMKRGGNAADALVGTTLCVGVIGMYHSGIGGGGFMLVRDSYGVFESIDFRETAPGAAFEDMYKNKTGASILGGLASGVPGEIKGLEYLHNKYGALPWHTVCNPAVHVARHGFPVTEDLVQFMNYSLSEDDNFLVDDPNWAIDFAPNGILLGLNDIMTRKRYANTLEQIASKGARVFYHGDMAHAMVKAVQAANGTMTTKDLAEYNIVVGDPMTTDYRGYKLYSCGAPSSGSVALSVFKTIEGYNMSDPKFLSLSTHRLDEAIRFAYGARTELGDPAYVKGIDAFETSMLTPSKAAEIRGRISDWHTQNVSAYNPKKIYNPESHGTSHVVTADKSGMTVTLTTTINLLFGSHIIVPETGVILNDEQDDFSIPGVSNFFGFVPSPVNFIRPGKRPLSSITPVIVEHPDGSHYLSVGAAGGSQIITATIQALWHVLDHGMTISEALAQPRMHDQLIPNVLAFESGFDRKTVEFMKDRGHNATWVTTAQSAVQGIRRLKNGTFEAAGEPRQVNSAGMAI